MPEIEYRGENYQIETQINKLEDYKLGNREMIEKIKEKIKNA
jgi:hypothetical protein